MAETPKNEIRTRFTLDGLTAAVTRLREFSASARKAVAPVATAGRAAARSVEGIAVAARAATQQMQRLSTAALSAARAAGSAVKTAASVGIGGAIAAGQTAAAVGGVGAGLVGAGLTAAVTSTSALVLEQERLSRAAGTSAASIIALTSAAASYGAEADEVMGALSSLTDKIAEAARGEGAAEVFQRIGVAVQGANGRLRDSADVLSDIIERTRSLNRTERANIFNDLLGGDAEKLAEFLDRSSRGDLTARRREAEALGAVASPQQVAITREWTTALQSLRLSLRGLGLEVASRFLPVLTDLVRHMTSFIAANRVAIADAAVRMWDRFWQTVTRVANAVWDVVRRFQLLDVVRVSVGLLLQTLSNLWTIASGGSSTFFKDLVIIGVQVLALIERITRFGAANRDALGIITPAWSAFAKAVQDVAWLLLDRGDMITTSWVAKLPETLASLRETFQETVQLARDLWNALTFNDSDVSKDNKWIIDLRDQVIQVSVQIAAAVLGIVQSSIGTVQSLVVSAVRLAGAFAADVLRTFGDVRTVVADVVGVLAEGAGARTNSTLVTGLKDDIIAVRDVVVEFAGYLGRLWQTFKEVMSTLASIFDPILKIFGTDFASTALVLGVLRFTGILGTLGTVIGAVTGGLTGLIGLGAGLSPIIAALGTIAGGIAGGAALGAYGAQKAYDADVLGIRSRNLGGFGGNEAAGVAAMAALAQRAAADHDRRAAMRPPSYVPDRVGASTADGGIDVWSSAPSRSVDVNLNIAGRTYTGRYAPSTADDLTRTLSDVARRGG